MNAKPGEQPRPLLVAENLRQEFTVRRARRGSPATTTVALDRVSIAVYAGERVGVVGESGSGKTTLGRAITGLVRPTGGSVHFDGTDIYRLKPAAMRRLRARLQIVFQDPAAALDSRMRVADLIGEGLRTHSKMSREEVRQRVVEIAEEARIPQRLLASRPRALSGGQRQRVAVARSIVLRPELVVLDEPVSALDMSVQAQLLNMLLDLQELESLTYVFIVHDLAVARWFCTRIVVMYRGTVVEEGTGDELFEAPAHPYTAQLLAAVPGTGKAPPTESATDNLAPPSPTGCVFQPRCDIGRGRRECGEQRPELQVIGGRTVACHHPQHFTAAKDSA